MAAALIVTALLGLRQGIGPGFSRLGPAPFALSLSCAPLAVFLLDRIPGHPIGLLMLGAGLGSIIECLAICWSSRLFGAWVAQWMWWPPFTFIPLALLVFPDGRLPSRRWRPVGLAVIIASTAAAFVIATGATIAPRTFLTGYTPMTDLTRAVGIAALLFIAAVVMLSMAIAISLIMRWRRAGLLERRQIACLLPCCVLLVVGIPLSVLNVPAAWLPAVIGMPVGFTLAVLRFQLLDLDLYIHRGLVWTLVVAAVVSIYGLSVTALVTFIKDVSPRVATVIAGIIAAILFLPAEKMALRLAGRLLYGRRDDPYSILVRTGRHIEGIEDPLDVLPKMAMTLSSALQVPYVALELSLSQGASPLLIAHGRRPLQEPQAFPMVAHGRQVGSLLVAGRRPGDHFTRSEQRLLSTVSTQAAIAAEASRASLDLRRARERLVLAREEERRRLRDDLHDGVASGLVGARLLAAKAIMEERRGRTVQDLMIELDRELASCTDEVRTLIAGLRPAALDQGLDAALRGVADAAGPHVEVVVNGDLSTVPAAVEVAAYRIVIEAVTNTRKHGEASTCEVSLIREHSFLRVEIRDDGGVARDPVVREGVGLRSMRSRVEELGGHVGFGFEGCGFAVLASLPAVVAPEKAHGFSVTELSIT